MHRIKCSAVFRKHWPLFVVLVCGLIVYCLAATHSALWYDEIIEYYYSKYPVGRVPGDWGATNMYEHIVSTLQPPLYNVLMYLWLTLFDTEFMFRFAGILTMLLGSAGIYFAIYEATDNEKLWAAIGAGIFLLSSSGAYYALECAEYNLMLCCLAWSLYFLIACIKSNKEFFLYLYFILCCLSVYSQYGAVFAVLGMSLVLFIHFVSSGDKNLVIKFFIGAILSIVIAGLPLIHFFLIPQMTGHNFNAASHVPVFAQSNALLDYFLSLWNCLCWLLAAYTPQFKMFIYILIGVSLFVAIAGLWKSPMLRYLVAAILLIFTVYYFAVAFSYYAYNSWGTKAGTNNIGGRYCLFLLPIATVLFALAWQAFFSFFNNHTAARRITGFIVSCACIGFICLQVYSVDIDGWVKDDVREVVETWYSQECFNGRTLVHQWDDANFHYYLTHNQGFDDLYENGITVAGAWIRQADQDRMVSGLEEMGYLDGNSFYYVMPETWTPSVFIDAMEGLGYKLTYLYDGKSKLLLCEPSSKDI